MEQRTSRAAMVAVVSLVFLLLAGLTAVVLLKSSWGEDRARLLVEGMVDPAKGRLTVERLGDFEFFSPFGIVRARAQNIRFIDPDGRELAQIGEVTADLHLRSLLSREIYLPRASISGAQILCDIETGRPIVAARKAPRREAFEPRALDLALSNVDVGLYAVAEHEGKRVILARLSGQLDVTAYGDSPGVKMNLRSFRGTMSQPYAVRLNEATGVVDTSAETAADIRFSAVTSGAAVTGRLLWVPGSPTDPFQLDIGNISDAGGNLLGDVMNKMGGGGGVDMFRNLTAQ